MNDINYSNCDYEQYDDYDCNSNCGCGGNCSGGGNYNNGGNYNGGNSNSNCNCNCCSGEKNKQKRIKANRTTLKCGTPGAVTLPLATIAGTSFNVATVTVDTKDFTQPCIKFDFTSNIVTTAAVLTLNFQIFKQCKNQLVPLPVGPIWTFSRLVAVTESDSFSFAVCDCDVCSDECCTYSVMATVAGVATVGVTAISNATLSAIVVDNTCY